MGKIEIRDEIIIGKDPIRVWNILTDINSWRLWTVVIDRAAIYGQVRPGTAFKCLAGKWDFDCVIDEAAIGEKFVARGKTIGIDTIFRWKFVSAPDGAKVELAVEVDGWFTKLFEARIKKGFEDAIFTWLHSLKNFAERGAVRSGRDKSSAIIGRLPKKKISILRSFSLLQLNRHDRDEED